MKAGMKLVAGVGINDADYKISEVVDGALKLCPFYRVWSNMLLRVYSEAHRHRWPTYADVTVCTEWHKFSNFRTWMQAQDWEGHTLDKDILSPGNRVYAPDTCIFVPQEVNNFILTNPNKKGMPVGVGLHRKTFRAKGKALGVQIDLGAYSSAEMAHLAWLTSKRALANELADRQTNPRLAEALRTYYYKWCDPWFEKEGRQLPTELDAPIGNIWWNIGDRFGEGGKWELVGRDGGKLLIYCAVCALDPELFGDGVFKSKQIMRDGVANLGCGCSHRTSWTHDQIRVRLSRAMVASPHVSVLSLIPAGQRSKETWAICSCLYHGEWVRSTANILRGYTTCPKC